MSLLFITHDLGIVRAIGPDEVDPSGAAEGRAVPLAAAKGGATVRLMPVHAPGKSSGVARLVIDDGREFARDTRALVRAIEAARFDRDGRLVEGADRIAQSNRRLVEATKGRYRLTLYVRAAKARQTDLKLLSVKVDSVNDVLEAPGTSR